MSIDRLKEDAATQTSIWPGGSTCFHASFVVVAEGARACCFWGSNCILEKHREVHRAGAERLAAHGDHDDRQHQPQLRLAVTRWEDCERV